MWRMKYSLNLNFHRKIYNARSINTHLGIEIKGFIITVNHEFRQSETITKSLV